MMRVVIKLGGEVIRSGEADLIAADIAALSRDGVSVVVVHGGGPQATELQRSLGQEPKIVAGRRITDEATLDVMKMIVAGKLNVDLCAKLQAHGARPVGLHGASSFLIRASRRPPKRVAGAGPEPIDFGLVGDVTGVGTPLLTLLCGEGYCPVVACLGSDEHGNVYNINADTVATRVAMALSADSLVLVTDVPGVLRDVGDPGSRLSTLSPRQGRTAIEDGTVTKGMVPKVEECIAAVETGVRRVHIVGKLGPGDLAREIREPGSRGTVVAADA